MDGDFVALQQQRLLQLVQNAADDGGDMFGVAAGIEQHDELVAAKAGDQVILPYTES